MWSNFEKKQISNLTPFLSPNSNFKMEVEFENGLSSKVVGLG
jgi:hypothetical protein